MPTTVAIGAAGGAFLGSGGALAAIGIKTWVGGALLYGGLAAASYVAQKQFGPKAPKIAGQDARQVRGSFRATRTPAKWVVGRARLGGWQYSIQEAQDQGDILGYRAVGIATALSETGFTEVERIWVNGQEEPTDRVRHARNADRTYQFLDPDGPLLSRPGPFTAFVPGKQDDADNRSKYYLDLTDASSFDHDDARYVISPSPRVRGGFPRVQAQFDAPNIPNSSDRRADGVGILYSQLWQPSPDQNDDRSVWAGVPSIETLVKGIQIRWPADTMGNLTASPAWTDNAAAIIYWYTTERMGWPHELWDFATFRAAYAKCEEVWAPTGLPDGFPDRAKFGEVNGIISADDDHGAVLRELLFCMSGHLVLWNGKLELHAGVDSPATKSIGDSDIIETVELRPAPAYQDRINAAQMGCAQSAAHAYTVYELPELVDTAAVERDGHKLSFDLGTRAFVNNPARCQQLLAVELRRSRAQAVHVYKVKPGAAFVNHTIKPGSRILVTDSEAGLVDEKMQVLEATRGADMSVVLTLRKAPDGIYALDTVTLPAVLPPPPPPPERNDPPPSVEGLTVVARAVRIGGSIRSWINVSWTDTGRPVALVLSGPDGLSERTVSIAGAHSFAVAAQGDYTVRARNVGPGGVESRNAETGTATLSWSHLTPPAVPSLMTLPFAALDESRLSLEMGFTASWGEVGFTIVVRAEGGGFDAEQVLEPGPRETRFDVPVAGQYTVTAYLKELATGLTGPTSSVSVDVSTAALVPPRPVVTAQSRAYAAADGSIASSVTLTWTKTSDRAMVVLTSANGYRQEQDTLENRVDFEVPADGPYSYSVVHYNAVGESPMATGVVNVDWSSLAPTEPIVVVQFSPIAEYLHLIVRRPVDPAITGLELRYRSKDATDPDPLPTITADDWSRAPRLETTPIVLGALGNNIITNSIIPANGEYRVFGRWISTNNLYGPVSEVGTGLFSIPTGASGFVVLSAAWPGTLENVGALHSRGGPVLVFDPGVARLQTRSRWNGQEGWPFGREQEWSVALPRSRAREAPTSLRARWRPGAGSPVLGASDRLPDDWLVSTVTDRTQYFRDLLLTRASTSSPVQVTLRFRPEPFTGNTTVDPFLVQGVEQDASWMLTYGTTEIELGAPDAALPGAVRDATQPYDWTPQTASQAALATLMDGLADGSITDLRLRIRWKIQASYQTEAQDMGEEGAWQVRVSIDTVSPPSPDTGAPTPNATDYTVVVDYGATDQLGSTVAVEPNTFTTITSARWVRAEVQLGDDFSGAGFASARLEWLERV